MKRILFPLFLSFVATTTVATERYAITPSPVIGYDPTMGAILGGALFVYPDGKAPDNRADRYFDVIAMRINRPAGSLISHFRQSDLFPGVDFSIKALYSNFFAAYYGEGSDTPKVALAEIDQRSLGLRPELAFGITPQLAWTLFADHRRRVELAVDRDPNARLFPDESTTAVGIGLRSDSRDHRFSPGAGHLARATLSWTGPGMSSLVGAGDVVQLEADWRQYATLGDFRWAGRIACGISTGTPGYLFRYTLGGSYRLRGFQSNRLRGRNYWLAQNELRHHLWRIVSGTAFIEAGSVGDRGVDAPVYSYGLGLRFALPPDDQIKLRVDFGHTDDGDTRVYVDFGQAF